MNIKLFFHAIFLALLLIVHSCDIPMTKEEQKHYCNTDGITSGLLIGAAALSSPDQNQNGNKINPVDYVLIMYILCVYGPPPFGGSIQGTIKEALEQ